MHNAGRFSHRWTAASLLLVLASLPMYGWAQIAQNNPSGAARTVSYTRPDGTVRTMLAAADADEDGISNELEINGFYYCRQEGVLHPCTEPCNGQLPDVCYHTDPDRWSTDGDPYSDFTEATGVNMHAGVPFPESHPLVAARPVIRMELLSYDVVPLGTITDTEGREEQDSFTNTSSSQHEVGGSVTVGVKAKLNPFEPAEASLEVTASYSHTWSTTKSSTSTSGVNWSRARSTNPSEAARLKLLVYMENVGSAPALKVQPEFNLKIGDKLIASIKPAFTQNELNTGERSEEILIDSYEDGNGTHEITLTMEELKAIQSGMPISLVVTQVNAEVPRWNSDNKSFESGVSWSSFEGNIDPVVVNLDANLGDGERYFYQIYAGTRDFDPGMTFRDLLSLVFDVKTINGADFINGRKYPDDWYVAASPEIVQDWNDAGRPASMMGLNMQSKNAHNATNQAVIKMASPGSTLGPKVNLATFTPDFRQVLVSAFPNGFPILSAKARVTVNGEVREIALENDGAFFKNADPLEYPADSRATVFVEDVRGDVTEVNAVLPAFYRNAEEVLRYSPALPIPGGDEYLLFLAGDTTKPAVIYCDFSVVEGDTVAKEYLTLNAGEQSNFADGQNDGIFMGKVFFRKIRVTPDPDDPVLTVMGNDMSFAEAGSQNSIFASYGTSGLCDPTETSGANIDLTGTAFQLDPFTGFADESRIDIDAKRKIVDIGYQSLNTGCTFVGVSGALKLVYQDFEDFDLRDGLAGNSLLLNANGGGQKGYVDMGAPATLEVSDAITLEAWIKPTLPEDTTAIEVIVNKEGEYELFRWSDGTIRWALANSSPGWKSINTYYKAKANKWVHVALVYDRTAATPAIHTYINGNLFHAAIGAGAIGDFSGHINQDDFRVAGREASSSASFTGFIDEVRIWNVARSKSQIRRTFVDILSPEFYATPDSGLIGYWRFDALEDLGVGADGADDVRDYSVNANHGDLVGDIGLSDITTGVRDTAEENVPMDFVLQQNYPNPFNPTTTIRYDLATAGDVELSVYNMMGQKIRTLVSGRQSAGTHHIQWNGRNETGLKVASGVYVYRLNAGGNVQSRKMSMLK